MSTIISLTFDLFLTSELGDRQSSHPVKTLLQYYGKSLEALPGVAYPVSGTTAAP